MSLTVIIPTISGREDFLAAAVESFPDAEVLTYKDMPGCGPAWALGASRASGDYILFSADDIDMHHGWYQAASRITGLGYLPAPRILNTDGTLQSCGDWGVEMRDGAVPEFTRVPFVSREQWVALEPLVAPFLEDDTHYFTDNIFTWAGRRLGMETVVCRAYECTHHLATWGRGAGMSWEQRMSHDHQKFLKYTGSF